MHSLLGKLSFDKSQIKVSAGKQIINDQAKRIDFYIFNRINIDTIDVKFRIGRGAIGL